MPNGRPGGFVTVGQEGIFRMADRSSLRAVVGRQCVIEWKSVADIFRPVQYSEGFGVVLLCQVTTSEGKRYE